MTSNPLSPDDYTIGWISTLPVETAAAKLMLDTSHPPLLRATTDQNSYIFGNIGAHNVVIASLPSGAYGNLSAATVGMQLLSSFPAIRFVFMVGVGSGVPCSNLDIRLGDVVVSQPTDTSGGVIQYDLGKTMGRGEFRRTGTLNRPPKAILTALTILQAHHFTKDNRITEFVSQIPKMTVPSKAIEFARPTQQDLLFQAEYDHVSTDTCFACDRSKTIPRPPREQLGPVIHYGLIGSANQVVKDGQWRDQLAQDLGIYCVEMEAAGLMNDFPCLVVRGICDYADSHKNEKWRGYAAAVAAAYVKELLLTIPVDQINNSTTAHQNLSGSVPNFEVSLDLRTLPVIGNFLGRQDELDDLWQYLNPTNTESRKVAILHGLGGMGKTQLAIQFARNHKDHFSAIFWINGKTRTILLQSLSVILQQLPGLSADFEANNDEKLDQMARNALQWLAIKGNSRWLIIFDNVDQCHSFSHTVDDFYDITEFLPFADHGSILITSRLQALTELGKSFSLRKLDTTIAIQLLLQSSHMLSATKENVLEYDFDTLTLTNHLDGLPLAIVIAGKFMRETGTSVAEYLRYYQESWPELQLQSSPERQYQQGNILQSWIISYREIEKRDARAAKLLLFLAHFDNQDIWFELVKNSRHSTGIPTWLEDTISSEIAFKMSLKQLVRFSFLQANYQAGSYSLHPVVQDWCQHLAVTGSDANSDQLKQLALVSVGYTVMGWGMRSHWNIQQRLIPHANFVRHWSFPDGNVAVWGAFQGLGDLYKNMGALKEAEDMYQQALAGYEKIPDCSQMFSLNATHNLGNLYFDQGKLTEAEDMYQRALKGYDRALGADLISVLRTLNNLGLLYSHQGKLTEAESIYQQVLAGKKRCLGSDHLSTLDTMNNIGLLFFDRGQFDDAEQMYQGAMEGYKNALGSDHETHLPTLNTFNNIGILFSRQGRLDEAESMHQQALTGKEKALGSDHPSTLDTVNNLGLLSFERGKFKEAEEMYQRALAGYEKSLNPSHTATLDTVNNLGLLYFDQGKLQEAEKMYQRALVGYEETLGSNHASTLRALTNIGSLYSRSGKLKEAEKIYQQTLVGYEKAVGCDHTFILDVLNNLGNLYTNQGNQAKAEKMYQQALAGYEALNHDHTFKFNTLNNLGLLYYDQGKLEEAKKMYQRALRGYKEIFGPEFKTHQPARNTLNNLDALYSQEGKLEGTAARY